MCPSSTTPAAAVLTHLHDVDGGQILEVVLNRPEVHNAVNAEAAGLLLAAWRRFRDDPAIVVAILRGAGEQAFSAGADLSGLAELGRFDRQGDPQALRAALGDGGAGLGPMGGTRIVQHKPVITVSQGYTYAGGLELFCHGHIRLAEPQASFSVACRRWGVPLVDGGTVYLPRLLGMAAALPLIITGQRISAERAHQLGLVWELVPPGQGPARARQYAEQICRLPRDAMLADLASALESWHLSLEAALAREAENLEPVGASASMREGVARFLRGERFWFQ